jgi:hypothetical protein
VLTAFRFDCEDGAEMEGAVHVAICARRRTVSSGNLMLRSRADETKVAIDHDVGVTTGSRLRYERRKMGEEWDTREGRVEERNVMGISWNGMRYGVESVRRVPSNVLGSSDEGVRIRRVRAASKGEQTRPATAQAAVEMKTVTVGEVEERIEASGMAEGVSGTRMSGSDTPSRAARKERMKVSRVRVRME